jgi:hypothetical protein
VTLVPDIVGPGLVGEPGLGFKGVAGMLTGVGVWKYSGVVKLEQPAVLQAATFQRYCLPALRLAVKDVPLTLVSTTRAPLAISRTPRL